MKYFAGMDVSLEETAICVVDEAGRMIKEVRAASEHVIVMTPEEQLSFWNALNETPRLTSAQRRLGSIIRGRS